MGLPVGYVTDLGLPRSAELHMLGNGVMPQQAECALHVLLGFGQAHFQPSRGGCQTYRP